MTAPYPLICLVFSLVLFILAAAWFSPPDWPHRLRLVAAGLAFYILSMLVK